MTIKEILADRAAASRCQRHPQRTPNRLGLHPTEPSCPCELNVIDGFPYLCGRCPSCGYWSAHEPVPGVPLDSFSRRTCPSCGLPYWIIYADAMPFPRKLSKEWAAASAKGKRRSAELPKQIHP